VYQKRAQYGYKFSIRPLRATGRISGGGKHTTHCVVAQSQSPSIDPTADKSCTMTKTNGLIAPNKCKGQAPLNPQIFSHLWSSHEKHYLVINDSSMYQTLSADTVLVVKFKVKPFLHMTNIIQIKTLCFNKPDCRWDSWPYCLIADYQLFSRYWALSVLESQVWPFGSRDVTDSFDSP